MNKALFAFTFLASLFLSQLETAVAGGKPALENLELIELNRCPGGSCEIILPANRISKMDIGFGFGARSFYEIPNYSYLRSDVQISFTLADHGQISFDHMMHGMIPAKYMTITIKGADRKGVDSMSVTNPDGRFWTVSCLAQPADHCTMQLESAWTTSPDSNEVDVRQSSTPGRYLVKVYYDKGPMKTFSFAATAPR